MSLRPAWSTERNPGQPGVLHKNPVSKRQKKKKKKKKKKTWFQYLKFGAIQKKKKKKIHQKTCFALIQFGAVHKIKSLKKEVECFPCKK